MSSTSSSSNGSSRTTTKTPPIQLTLTQTQIPAGYQPATQFHPATPEYAASLRLDAARQGQYSADQIETALCGWFLENVSPELPAGVRMPEGLARSFVQGDRASACAATAPVVVGVQGPVGAASYAAAPASVSFQGPPAPASYAAAPAPAVFQAPLVPAMYQGGPAHAVVRSTRAPYPSSTFTVVEERQPRRTISNPCFPEDHIAGPTQTLAPSGVLAVIEDPYARGPTQSDSFRRFPLFEDDLAADYGPGVVARYSPEETEALLQEEREFDKLMAWAVLQGEIQRIEAMHQLNEEA
ncbi:hypothetical protein IQ07DRAFT_598150 [Pyrenochaeta sp. DS3sAY3a]|nr:hypothetical protein IQ07DRAFT_598150 [Pyrenochaeta sp. DS3sAY3a]